MYSTSAPQLQAALLQIDSQSATELDGEKAKAMICGYHEHWKGTPPEVIEVEGKFHLPIVNPDTGRPSRTFTQAGMRDGLVKVGGRLYLEERKTTAEDISDPNGTYWRRLAIDSQVSMYALSLWQEGRKVDGTFYDVLKKPTIRPKRIAAKDYKAMIADRQYCGYEIRADQIAEEETPRLYGLRLLRDTVDNPQKYYQRRTVPRLDADLLEWASELWSVADDIRRTRNTGRHYRNSGACMNWGRPCEFLGICSGYDTPDSDKWIKREHKHRELDQSGETLTHSEIRCFQTCRQKHHLKYDLRLERADRDDAEALVFGSLIHSALEAYYLALKDLQHGSNDKHPATEVGSQSSLPVRHDDQGERTTF